MQTEPAFAARESFFRSPWWDKSQCWPCCVTPSPASVPSRPSFQAGAEVREQCREALPRLVRADIIVMISGRTGHSRSLRGSSVYTYTVLIRLHSSMILGRYGSLLKLTVVWLFA